MSVNVGLPKDVDWDGRTVFTGVWKYPTEGPLMARRLNVDGDGQGDLAGHGGEQRAVLVYQLASYHHWQEHFGRDDLTYGNFGENLTVEGLPDDEVCIGDRYRIGEAEFEVTQPRVTCFRVGLRLGEPELPSLLVAHHRPGFYMRVITEGHIQAGDKIIKTRTGPGEVSVADTDALLYLPNRDDAKLRVAVEIPALSPGWQQSFQELLAEADSPQSAEPEGGEVAWSGFRRLVVASVTRETPTVTSIVLNSPDGAPLPAARAGQYLTLRLAGAGDPAPVRNYSLSGPADSGTYRISVKHEPHGIASNFVNRHLKAGDTIDVGAPRGEFVLAPGIGPVLLLSAGIGLTPVLCMLHQLAAEQSQREVWWIHSTRRPEGGALAAEADSLLASLARAHRRLFYTEKAPEGSPSEEIATGRLNAARLADLRLPSAATTAYLCGPSSFMDDMREALGSLGLAPGFIRTEMFGARDPINPGIVASTTRPPHPPEGPPGTGPLVTFARSGLSVPFGAGARNILELAEACDVPTRWSCRTGVCHTCITPLLDGNVAYSPVPLDPPGGEEVLICSARPESDVVVDL
ncbi:MAG TPA: MOSC domain-containing protein [Solirubrobacteraceae bacterium]|nr:MOSC domain-containing protein [Solirubrobacteraceae bacterium]